MSAVMSGQVALPKTSAWRTGLVLLLFDWAAILLALLASFYLRYVYDRSLIWEIYAGLWVMLLLFPLAYGLAGLYPGVGLTPPEEIRRITYSSSLVFLLIGASTFMYKTGFEYSRGAFVFALVLVPVAVALARALARLLLANQPWWGTSVVVLGAGQTGADVIRVLQQQPGLGFKPVAILDDDPVKHGHVVHGVKVIGDLRLSEDVVRSGVRHAIMAMPGVPRSRLIEIVRDTSRVFPHLLLIPDLFGLSSLWVSTRDLGGILGLELRQRLLLPLPRLTKRLMDVLLVVLASPLILLVCALVTVMVRVSSRGPILFRQARPGHGGNEFYIYKFRTMYTDAEARFELLPEQLKDEFKRYGKIQNDPRVTPIGSFLRKTSLDEFPQFWNVLKGDMSLVGPRAYLSGQVDQMGDYRHVVLSVVPGLTGLWQVSGRSEVTFKERLDMDSYYVRNWSPWLDIYLLARTIWTLAFSQGAY